MVNFGVPSEFHIREINGKTYVIVDESGLILVPDISALVLFEGCINFGRPMKRAIGGAFLGDAAVLIQDFKIEIMNPETKEILCTLPISDATVGSDGTTCYICGVQDKVEIGRAHV